PARGTGSSRSPAHASRTSPRRCRRPRSRRGSAGVGTRGGSWVRGDSVCARGAPVLRDEYRTRTRPTHRRAMAVFAVTYTYGPDTEKRMGVRPAHREWQAAQLEAGRLLASGPLEDELTPGGLLILRGADKEEIASLLAQDPYADAGVIDDTTIRA